MHSIVNETGEGETEEEEEEKGYQCRCSCVCVYVNGVTINGRFYRLTIEKRRRRRFELFLSEVEHNLSI